MTYSGKIAENSDSLIELLSAQCVDLEKLLALAREENAAAKRGNFEEILNIVSKRTELSSRLETFQRQIGELREHLGINAKTIVNNEIAVRIIEIANLTLAQDQKTKLLLTDSRNNSALELQNLEKGRRGANAYMRESTKGLAYNRSI